MSAEARWDRFCVAAVACAVLLRLVYLGAPELLFEEAYYWNYAQHPDIGYLDHPLVVAWIIRLFVSLLGNLEIAVRAGAFLSVPVTAFFCYRLTRELLGSAAALRALVLVACLPFFFFSGFFMSPDAPLAACWAAAVYYMHRAAIAQAPRAWVGLGVAVGLGMISKYTMALPAAAFVLYVLADRTSRRWLLRPEPYLAALIALALFTPVIAWNWQHHWASFSFQSEGRLESRFSFSLPRFVVNVFTLLAPTGVLSVVAIAACREKLLSVGAAAPGAAAGPARRRSYVLLVWLALFPVAVFAAASLFRVSKLNWTGPAWLALLPLMAPLVTPAGEGGAPRLVRWCRRAWPPTIAILLLIYAGTLQWLGGGLPGVGYPPNTHLIGWRGFGGDVERLVERLERETGQEILVVGMDRNRIASGLAYYRTRYLERAGRETSPEPAFDTASENLFGGVGLMYAMWFPSRGQEGKTMLLVGADRGVLETNRVFSRVATAGAIGEIPVAKAGKPAGRYYYRLVTGYRPAAGRD
ncbi:MAG TPA: glycosyltransferase family 39 protein [Burkholderiales bacterium]|nr:glycosyltransferase family 39 protein [Burkholderiales bacterium]